MDPPPSYSVEPPVIRGPDPSRLQSRQNGIWDKLFKKNPKHKKRGPISETSRTWSPVTLKAPLLCSVIIISGGLIVVIQLLLSSSQKNDGIIFSRDINGLPLSKSFSYLYLPTIIAVLYSFLWSWIDLDAKRLEPYYQLSQECGASAEDSILLEYPYDFAGFVPIKAIKRRHWPVFTASVAMLLIFWGITPTQAGIFATDNVVRTFPMTMLRSTGYLTNAEQNSGLTATYAQSVYNIAWLNESLPAFMSRDYMLAPFGPQENLSDIKDSETWTGQTTRYSVDVSCSVPKETKVDYLLGPCQYQKPSASIGFKYRKTYSSLYVGYHDEDGMADYYLSQFCPKNVSHSFLIRWVANTWNTTTTTAINETALYCEPTYYQQDVNATVSLPRKAVMNITTLGPKTPLPEDMFNATNFEWGMNSAEQRFANRGDYPTSGWADMRARLNNIDVDTNYLPKMASFAIAALQRPAADYLDPEVLRASYEAAYRLLFSRQLVDVLSTKLEEGTATTGQRQYRSQSVIVVPAFAYLTEGLLGGVILFTAGLIYLSVAKQRKLNSDPADISSLISLVADSPEFLDDMKRFDRTSTKYLNKSLQGRVYMLGQADEGSGFRLERLDKSVIECPGSEPASQDPEDGLKIDGIRPRELRLWTGSFLLSFFSAMLVTFAVLYAKIERQNGIPLPSEDRFVRQLVESYLPTVVATLIEPIWLVLNRLILTLQPFEELRRGKALASRSIAVDYNSLPPQLVLFKAFRARHLVLGAVCCMTLLAHFLSIAFSALFLESEVMVSHAATYSAPLQAPLDTFALKNRTDLYLLNNRANTDQFYVVMSNLTAGTPLSSWVDERFFYLPFESTNVTHQSWSHRATTRAFGAEIQCVPLETEGPNTIALDFDDNAGGVHVNISATIGDRVCETKDYVDYIGGKFQSKIALELNNLACGDILISGWIRANVTRNQIWTSNGADDISQVTFHSLDWTFIACRAVMKTGMSEVTVDYRGKVLDASPQLIPDDSPEKYFVQNNTEIISSIYRAWIFPGQDTGSLNVQTWHNDSYPSDFYNYLILKSTEDRRLLDPDLPPPTFNETAPKFAALYSQLVAITLSENSNVSFSPSSANTQGSNIKPETRIFMSKPMFLIAEAILGLYVVVLVAVYVRRPWRILPRLPTTIASNIGYFAASHAVLDLKGTGAMSVATRNKHLASMGHRYGFGTFVGTDGKPHRGIERQPYFAPLTKTALTTKEQDNDGDKAGEAKRPWTSYFQLKNPSTNRVVEGGWL
ncbi:uncharacterized protein K452DRAFT_299670 [Aplosporella prunicola CBS 121167]|uniref:Uncharacterized protein n=1 Tax=Aplosporella prunicola CBS 121167 TaxID=1176127 RepID=A0A6A6B832_9PEZI|nr:uncharacterized protein K452DRAFT_299670 [Aplosporella prunicola CBS 121167]KAF2140309.1 hypothetical protein K452DRAFT_299670 [Aplosporella prunicola CBS 121167]